MDLSVKLDTEVRAEDLEKNIIVIGGPVVNTITGKFNPKLPIRFEKQENWAVHSTISEKTYTSDEIGIIIKTKNPFNPRKSLLLVAGKRYSGTKAAIIAFVKGVNTILRAKERIAAETI